MLGDIASHRDRLDAERGEAYYRQALTLAEPRGMRPLIARCHLGLATLHRRTGKLDKARQHFGVAAAICHDMGVIHWLEHAEAESPG